MTNCTVKPNSISCPSPSQWSECKPWELIKSKDQCFIDQQTQEQLLIAGANINLYKLLGIHEQTKLIDIAENGNAISGGDAPGFPAKNAFTSLQTEWRSKQTGVDVLTHAYIGYDFGELKIITGRSRYGVDANVRQHITTIKIKQSKDPFARATKVRIERSDNGKQWFGVAVVDLPNDENLNTVHFKHSVPSRFWRLRPLVFTGASDLCKSWGVLALELSDFSKTNEDNIQDKIFMENRDRDYAEQPITLKGYYELVDTVSDLTKFGIDIGMLEYRIRVNFNATVLKLGRPIIIGDIIELPSEVQYTPQLRSVNRYLEVTDVTWDTTTYTPGWQPLMLLVTAKPAYASQETQDIFGDLSRSVDESGLFDSDDGNNEKYQDTTAVEQTIKADALTNQKGKRIGVPERGSEGSNVVREFEQKELEQAANVGIKNLNKIGFNRTGLYVEDALPQNNAPFTVGPDFPTNPKDGDYHRLEYAGLSKDVPARLYRWSSTKGRWIYLETDRRAQFNQQKAILDEYLTSKYAISAKEIT